MWRHNSHRQSTYIVFAGSILINKNRIASNYSTIGCRNSPHRQLKFAIGHNSSLIAILRIHASTFSAHRPSGTCLSIMAVMGSTYSTNNFTLSPIKDFGAITRVALAKRSQEGHWGGAKGMPGFWATGPGCGVSCGDQASAAKRAGAGVR
jgi:hypothetical protein